MATSFGKQYESPLALTRLLQSRGLMLDDVQETERLLKRIGYYRLSAYWYPLLQMPKSTHRFKAGARFTQALMMYRFDLELRLLIFRQIAKIEVAVRSAIVNIISRETGDMYWMTNGGWFMNAGVFANSMALMDKEYRKSSVFLCSLRYHLRDSFGLGTCLFQDSFSRLCLGKSVTPVEMPSGRQV